MTALVAAVIAAAGPPAFADDDDPVIEVDDGGRSALFEASRAADEHELATARDALAAVMRAGRLQRGDTVRALRMSGEVAAALGDTASAERHFQRMLLLDPTARPRRDYAAAVWPALERAADALRGRGRMRIQVRPVDHGGVAVRVMSDPLRMVAAAWARYRGADDREHEVLVPSSGGVVLHLPGRKLDASVKVGVTDEFGNRLAETTLAPMAVEASFGVGRDDIADEIRGKKPLPKREPDGEPSDVELAAPPDPEPEPEPEAIETAPIAPSRTAAGLDAPSRPIYARWYTWAGASVVAGGAAAYFALETRDTQLQVDALVANSREHTYDEVIAAEDRGRQQALLTNVCLGGAAALAATAILVAVWPHDDRPEQTRVTATLAPGQLGLGLAMGF